jgi:hypothetical protein
MSTSAMIAIWDSETGAVEASYVHCDGYVEGVGNELIHFYNTNESAAAVATVGYLSSLDRDLETSVEKSVHKDQLTVSYESVEQYMKNGYDCAGAEYLYLWDGVAWFVASHYGDRRFTDVVTMLEQKDA